MARNLRLFCGVLSFYYVPLLCGGFNVDHRFPVIKEGKTSGSFFGFSVALHKQTVGAQRYLLLTGAPKEKSLGLMNVNETGAVYSCPITTKKTDCSRMDLVTSTNPSEMVEGMWLGVMVASQKDQVDARVLTCGHRYVKVILGGTEQQWKMVGKCYVRGNDLTLDPNDEWQTYLYEYCNPSFDLDLEGMCSLGISGGLTSTQVYVGSTGSYAWQGNVHTTWRNPDPANTWDFSDNDFGKLDRRYSYIGYSVVEEQRLLIPDDYTLVTGAPRDHSMGSVTLGRMDSKDIVPVLVIPGKQVGSYFGNSLAVADLNNNSWNDLLVGAPFYFDRAKDHGGAVYIYMNENGWFQKEPSLVLKGPVGSGFGFALAAAGDLNQDGFQDFAVGAPFHETGKVYIWTGSKEGITEKYSQVIEGKSVGDGKFKTFGYSLNGGMDMDENSYPDLLVGTLDDRIALLRTRPVLHLTKEFSLQPKTINTTHCYLSNKTCIRAKVCFSYTLSNGKHSLKKSVVVRYTVEADVERRRNWRVLFCSSKDATHTGTITLNSPDQKCQRLELNVTSLVTDKLEPVVFQLNVSLPEQSPDGQGLQDLDAFPVLSQQKLTQRAEINFQKACGSDNKCSSNLQLTAEYTDDSEIPYPRVGAEQVLQYDRNVKKVELMVEVTNLPEAGKLAEDAHQATLNVSIPDMLSFSGFRFMDGATGECRLDPELHTVICELGNPLGSGERVKLRLIFETGRIDLNTRRITSYLQLSTLSEQDHLDPVPVLLLVEISIQTTFTIEQPQVQTYFSGTVVGESAMVKTSDVGSLVEYTFNVELLGGGGSAVGTLGIEFEWPLEVQNGKWLLYVTEISMNGTSDHHCVPPGDIVNALNLNLTEGSGSRRTRRQAVAAAAAADDPGPPVVEPQAVATLLSTRKETVTLDCWTARCTVFTCPLRGMQSRARVTVRSRVWNSTMLEDYSKALRVKVKGMATLKLITDMPGIKMESQTREFSVDIDPVLGEEAPYQAPLWIIIVAAAAGVLLLGVISLILWKLGFFRRALYYRVMPKYQGVWISKADRCRVGLAARGPQRKYLITNWTEIHRYY